MSSTFVEALTPVLARGDLGGAWDLLHSLEGERLRAAKAWFAANRRWSLTLHEHITFAGDEHEERWVAHTRATWIVGMCAVRLCGPSTAAARAPWRQWWDFKEDEGEAAFVHLLWDTDRAWVAQFVEAASRTSLGAQARNTNGQLSRVLRAAAVHHHLPCPTGGTFLARWLAGTHGAGSLADQLTTDPLMPDLLHHYLRSGHCGDSKDLPDAVAELCRRGVADRSSLLELVLEQLTAPQRPASQLVLAQITAALALRPDEVSGGSTYLLGVLATSTRTVVPVLLPLAVDLVQDEKGLRELTSVLAARPEKGPRETLLSCLKRPAMQAAVGIPAVLQAVTALAEGEDAAFAAKAARLAMALGAGEGSSGGSADAASGDSGLSAPLGLWTLRPTPIAAPARVHRYWPGGDPSWDIVLSSARAEPGSSLQPVLVGRCLDAVADGSFDEDHGPRNAAVMLLSRQRLSMRALTSVLDDLFLGGGLQSVWPSALDIADAACAAPRVPPGLADLLRTLARHAPEVPRPYPVPTHVARLAGGRGTSKAQTEARVLVALLHGGTPEAARAQALTDSPEVFPDVPAARPRTRGLWDVPTGPLAVLPSLRRLAQPVDPVLDSAGDLPRLRALVAADYNGYAQNHDDVCHWPEHYQPPSAKSGLTFPERVLAATVAAVRRHGAAAVRDALRCISRQYEPLDVILAVDLWVAGELDECGVWRVARAPGASLARLRRAWQDAGVDPGQLHERAGLLPPFGVRLAQPDDPYVQALVLPGALDSPVERLAFARAAESLLRAERHGAAAGPMLCTPTWADGTLDVDDLLSRLQEAASSSGTVGPVDLVQALHRLRPADAARAAEVPDGLRTEALFSAHGEEGADASQLVRGWLVGGGLPDLDPRPDQQGRWSTRAVAPVSFSWLAVVPPEIAHDPWSPGPLLPTLRMLPRWGDRVVDVAYAQWTGFDPRHFPGHAAGPLGVPLHDRLLSLLTTELDQGHHQGVPVLVETARQGRLVPAAAGAAAAGRHAAGTLRLGVLVTSLQRAFEQGALRGLWPSALAIADALCTTERKAPGLPDLLRLLTSHAHEVPPEHVQVPAGLRQLAEARGSTKSHAEARQLVAALQQAASA